MASLFRPTYTRVDKTTGERVKCKARKWWGQYTDSAGTVQRVPLKTANKAVAQLLLADLVRGEQQPQDKRPIAEHVAAWESSFRDRAVSEQYSRLVVGHVRAIVAGCKWKTLAEVAGTPANAFIEGLRGPRHEGKIGAKTSNDYRESLRSFCRWCQRDGRLTRWPLDNLRNVSIRTDRRHDRRPLDEDELARLLATTAESPRSFRGLTGLDRYHLYLTACATGFRGGELAALTPAAFYLDESPPVIRPQAKRVKNRKPTVQPVPVDLVPILQAYLVGRSRDGAVWPGGWIEDASEMLWRDLADAGIPYIVEGPDGPLYADFHALRHSFIALLDQPGMTLKQAMQLARHSDPRLTMRVYGKANAAKLGRAVNVVPVQKLALPLGLSRDHDSASVNGREPTSMDIDCLGGAAGIPDKTAAQDAQPQGSIAHRWKHGFFLVHGDLLALILALALPCDFLECRRAA